MRTGHDLSLEADLCTCWAELQEADPYLSVSVAGFAP